MVRRQVSGMIMNYVLFKYFTVKYSIILLVVSSQNIKFGLLIKIKEDWSMHPRFKRQSFN